MRTLVVGDIHGGLRGLVQVLERVEITNKDALIFVGDYVDGWSESAQVVHYLIELSKTNSCVFVKGNHDVWCQQWLSKGIINDSWYQHGGKETIASYSSFSEEEKKIHLHFFEAMPLYYIDDKKRLFVHAGFTSMHGVEKEKHQDVLTTDRTLWEMALTLDRRIDENSELYPKRLKHYTEIYIGHTPVTRMGSTLPLQRAKVWNIDTGAAFKGPLTILDVETKEFWQSDPVYQLYPNEKGRN